MNTLNQDLFMEKLSPDNQIILFEAIRRYYPQSENKDIVFSMIFQWFNEHSTQFVTAKELREICSDYFDFNKQTQPAATHPFQFLTI